jgi:3-hydroxyacyl-CoA dehydrogenase/enoyl-CoA hydratase/3-hydroxybutyryl-CoA epimerase
MTEQLARHIDELNAGAHRPKDVPASTPKKVGVLGAGFMGAGIAAASALAGLDVILIDRDQTLAEAGKARAAAQLADQEVLARILTSADYADLAGCDLVIESVFEDRAIKSDAIQRAQTKAPSTAIFASNTSTFPIASLTGGVERPQDFIGLHFFSPVLKMRLVEIIRHEATSDRAIAAAFDYARAIGKTPIIVNDGYEFFANRCVNAYLREGHIMLSEGVPPPAIELAAQTAGMPVGPLALSDEIGIDLIHHIFRAMKSDLGPAAIDARQEKLLDSMVASLDRRGRKNRKGFYDYSEAQPKSLWSGLADLAETKSDPEKIDADELKRRLLAIQALEALRSLEKGIVTDPREADVGSVLGFGFPPATGGVLSYIDGMGAKRFLALCEQLEAKYGARFIPPLLLKDLAQRGERIYGHFIESAS